MEERMQFEIIDTIATLSESTNGWKKELNLVSWNGRDAKFDIRAWSSNHGKMGKGITLSPEEVSKLMKALNDRYPDGDI